MKKTLIYLALAFVVIVNGCKTDDNDNPEPTYGFRLIKLTSSTERSNEEEVVFTYEGDKIASWLGTYEEGAEEYRAEVIYPSENIIEFLLYDMLNGVSELEEKMVFTFSNNKVTMVVGSYYEGTQLIDDYKSTYEYNADGNIIQSFSYNFNDGNEELSNKHYFSYNGSLLIEHVIYQHNGVSWVETYKTVYNYENDILINSIRSYFLNNEWIENNKHEFVYNGTIVTKVISYTNSGGNAWELSYTTNYSYDNDGNMTTSEEITGLGYSYLESYTYEAKQGNLSVFDFNGEYGYPNPIYSPNSQLQLLRHKER